MHLNGVRSKITEYILNYKKSNSNFSKGTLSPPAMLSVGCPMQSVDMEKVASMQALLADISCKIIED